MTNYTRNRRHQNKNFKCSFSCSSLKSLKLTLLRSSAGDQWLTRVGRSWSKQSPQLLWIWSASSDSRRSGCLYGPNQLRSKSDTFSFVMDLREQEKKPNKTSNRTFTVHGYSSLCTLTHMQEASNDQVRGCWAVHEEEIMVFKSCVLKPSALIQLLVQADHISHVALAEELKVCLRCMERITLRFPRTKLQWV